MDTATGGLTSDWYLGTQSSQSPNRLLESTFDHAKILLRSLLKAKDYECLFPPPPPPPPPNTDSTTENAISPHSVNDVQTCIRDAQARYEARTKQASDPLQNMAPVVTPHGLPEPTTPLSKASVKARVWLTSLSEKLLHYSNIFDALVQQYPEHISLAWGTFKLLFTAVTNHAETTSKLAKSLSTIADLLPQHSLHLVLYPTPQMQLAVARLYAQIMNFFLSALKWYKSNPGLHAVKAILQPWDLKFKPEYDAISEESQQIERLANTALKAEVRDTRLEVVQSSGNWELVRKEMEELRAENRQLLNLFRSRFDSMESSVWRMGEEIRLDLSSQRTSLSRIHLNQMLSLPMWSVYCTSGESLQFCRSIRNRRRDNAKLSVIDVARLEEWASQRRTGVLLIDTHAPLVAKTFMVDMINLIGDHRLPVIWALRYADYWDRPITVVDLVRMLVLQGMQVGADRILGNAFPVTVEHLREAASLSDWIGILGQILSYLSHVFVILDPDLLAYATENERGEAMDLLDMMRSQISNGLKIVSALSSINQSYAEELEQENACVRIQTGSAKDWRISRRPRRRPIRRR